jgi:hypothetical protein
MLLVYNPKLSFSLLHLFHPVIERNNEKKSLSTHLMEPRTELLPPVPEI